MTDAQIEALALLKDGPRTTTAHTHGQWIGGRVAYALVKLGYAKRRLGAYEREFEITDAGRAAYEKAMYEP